MAKDVVGTVYLICFDEPLKHARHYIGWAKDLEARLALHRAGQGSCLMAAVRAAGISWHVARTWTRADRRFERELKKRRAAHLLCPHCRQEKHERKMRQQRDRRAAKRPKKGEELCG